MPFNEEIVVRAFYNSAGPIISAVGHQVDHPLSDEAADLAAPTPSAAAEIAVPMKEELAGEIDYLKIRINTFILSFTRELKARITNVIERRTFREPLDIIASRDLLLTDLENRAVALARECVSRNKTRLYEVPDIKSLVSHIMKNKIHRFNVAVSALDQLSPLSVLRRGYTIAMDRKNNILRSIDDADVGSIINLIMKDGSLECSVNSKDDEGGINGKKEVS
jgi:exodeoxyribonuclease VII large subunit